MKSRLYVEFNPTPVLTPNQDWQGAPNPKTGKPDKTIDAPDAHGNPRLIAASPIQTYARKHPGAELAIVAYNGTFNRAPGWSDVNGGLLDPGAKGTGTEANLCDPIDPRAVKALVNLACHPTRYGDVGSTPMRPIFLDAEGGGMSRTAGDPLTLRRAMYQACLNALAAARGVQYNVPIYSFCYPWRQMDLLGGAKINAGCEDLDQQLAGALNGAVFGGYQLDPDVLSEGSTWFDRLQSFERLLDREYPGLRQTKIAFINPVQYVYFPASFTGDWQPYAARAGQPVSLDLWRRQNEALVSLGYDRFLWLSDPAVWSESEWKEYVDALQE